jgi:ribosomal protein S18 acetylase RimI-like enzyme
LGKWACEVGLDGPPLLMRAEVRRIRPEEGQTLKQVRLAALKDSPSAFGSIYQAEALRTDAEWAQRAELASLAVDRVTFLAFLDANAVGLVGGYRPDPRGTVVELVSMWTSPEARRTGLGRSLVGAVVDWAAALAVVTVDLWVTRGNDAAQQLYRAMGFRETGDYQPLPSDPCKDELRMTLGL